MIGYVKIGLFFAFRCYSPFRQLVQIREISVCMISMIYFGHMRHITIWQKLPINAGASYHINLVILIFFQLCKQLLRAVHYSGILHPIPGIG